MLISAFYNVFFDQTRHFPPVMYSGTSLSDGDTARIVGIDLAWGDKERDGLCLIDATRKSSKVVETARTFGDNELLAWLAQHAPSPNHVLLSIDAPLIIPNATGCRPVEKQISREFGKYHAFCHCSNSTNPNCVRPLRVARLLRENGFIIDFDLKKTARIAIEVYPHPAMVLLFELERIIKYKKGPVAQQRQEFKRLQNLISKCRETHFPELQFSPQIETLLDTARKQENKDLKENEDRIDALFCALIGYFHWRSNGHLCRVVGSLEEGFILLPPRFRNGIPLMFDGRTGQTVTLEMVNRLRDED